MPEPKVTETSESLLKTVFFTAVYGLVAAMLFHFCDGAPPGLEFMDQLHSRRMVYGSSRSHFGRLTSMVKRTLSVKGPFVFGPLTIWKRVVTWEDKLPTPDWILASWHWGW